MELVERVIGTEAIFSGRVVKLRRDTVVLPNGKEGKREVVEHSGAVAVIAMPDPQTVLLVRQFRLPAGKPLLEVVAGGVEPGEDVADCARRELREEIGKEAATLIPLFAAYVAPGYCTEKIYGFLAMDLSDAPLDADEDEFVEVVAMPLEALLQDITSGAIEDAKTIACATLAERYLRRVG
jgi:ADP-ribose pyrophosphatase